MRKLNAHHTWCSDWDPKTYLRYIVRECHGECMKIDPFNINDKPEITVTRSAGKIICISSSQSKN